MGFSHNRPPLLPLICEFSISSVEILGLPTNLQKHPSRFTYFVFSPSPLPERFTNYAPLNRQPSSPKTCKSRWCASSRVWILILCWPFASSSAFSTACFWRSSAFKRNSPLINIYILMYKLLLTPIFHVYWKISNHHWAPNYLLCSHLLSPTANWLPQPEMP